MKTVLIETPSDGLEKIFTEARGFIPIMANYHDLPSGDPDYVVFSGGADINPLLYGEKPHPKTHFSLQRDFNTSLLFNTFKHVPKIGVCRGAQFLCVMYGGKLIQHIEGHTFCDHDVWDREAYVDITVRGDHHQACKMVNDWCIAEAKAALDSSTDEHTYIMEAFYIEKGKALCVQFHPEWGHKGTEDYFFELMERYMQ